MHSCRLYSHSHGMYVFPAVKNAERGIEGPRGPKCTRNSYIYYFESGRNRNPHDTAHSRGLRDPALLQLITESTETVRRRRRPGFQVTRYLDLNLTGAGSSSAPHSGMLYQSGTDQNSLCLRPGVGVEAASRTRTCFENSTSSFVTIFHLPAAESRFIRFKLTHRRRKERRSSRVK